ncbi:MAG: N-acyl homoserine lactonase family protein [Proteobacteria bacterium]|nr:N-acyl homoserine lactonase family protein [Pseudomonadota bacterium]
MSNDTHEIYAIRYGHHARKAAENYIGGDPHDVMEPLDYFVWVIVGANEAIIVDTGFDATIAAQRGRQILRPVRDGLDALGIAPDKVANVIVSHLHYDHCGNDDLFAHARYHLQDREMEHATGRCMCDSHLRQPYECDYVVAMVRRLYGGRVVFHDGDSEIAPGISLHHVGGHARGLQCVRVKTRLGHVVLASDATHLYRHMAEGLVFPITYDVGAVLEGYAKLKKLACAPRHVVPGHDPLVLTRYPAARAGLEDWIVRLDVEPTLE